MVVKFFFLLCELEPFSRLIHIFSLLRHMRWLHLEPGLLFRRHGLLRSVLLSVYVRSFSSFRMGFVSSQSHKSNLFKLFFVCSAHPRNGLSSRAQMRFPNPNFAECRIGWETDNYASAIYLADNKQGDRCPSSTELDKRTPSIPTL
jgi:hypothetical protein